MNHSLLLPTYGGITDVAAVGMPVDECARLMARLAAVKKKGVFIAAARMTGAPEWELTAALGRWMWEDATQFRDLEVRVTELRASKSSVDKVLDYPLGDLLVEILHAPDSLALCVGWFDVLSPAYCEAIRVYLARTQPLVDQPSVRLLQHVLVEEEARLKFGQGFVAALAQCEGRAEARADWAAHFQTFLTAAQGILGLDALPTDFVRPTPRAGEEYRVSRESVREPWRKTTIPKANPGSLGDDRMDAMAWGRSQEMAAAEAIAVILSEWDGLPTEAIVDMARHCWDEVRHSLMGQAALEAGGHDFAGLESWVGFNQHALNGSPQKAYAHLALAIEAGTMAYPGGKRGEWETARGAGHALMTTFQDFDWADEVTHVKYGRKWLIEHHFKGNREAARQLADQTVKERVEFYAQYGVRDWMADRAGY